MAIQKSNVTISCDKVGCKANKVFASIDEARLEGWAIGKECICGICRLNDAIRNIYNLNDEYRFAEKSIAPFVQSIQSFRLPELRVPISTGKRGRKPKVQQVENSVPTDLFHIPTTPQKKGK